MSDDLYQQVIKTLAQADHGGGRLEQPDGAARLDNSLCGDRVTMEVRVGDGRVIALAHQTRGCLLCRASASLIGLRASGLAREELVRAAADVESLIAAAGTVPPEWPELESFLPARNYPSRHGCVLL
ncbi:MAG: iron-sulfur cluster assembly scaffold protein, partial [Rhodocyclaceae bacterium]